MKVILAGALVAVGVTTGAHAQYQYAPAPYQPATHPPSWSYDPYTSGLGPCPQKDHRDLAPCSAIMPPTYGQPSYWSR
jgi:hypothetical protein